MGDKRASGSHARVTAIAMVALAATLAALAGPAKSQQPTAPADTGAQGATSNPVASDTDSTVRPNHLTIDDVVELPGLGGFRLPSYDRSDGLSLRWGPRLALPNDRLVVDGLLTYRSHLGHFDPGLAATAELTPRIRLRAAADRSTRTNDTWSAPDRFNSTAVLVDGADGRNYFRADRVEGTAEWHADRSDESQRVGLWLGGRDEFDRSVGPDSAPAHIVWALFDRHDHNGLLRPNPSVARGRIGSVVAGARGEWALATGMTASTRAELEIPWSTPDGGRFAQVTVDGRLRAPTWSDQFVTLALHAVVTGGDTAPAQRFSYLGGINTLPTLSMLARGGDELVFLESLYMVPLRFAALPFVGAPAIGLHYIVGGAAVHRWPDLTENVGIRLQLFALGIDALIDPATHRRSLTLTGAIPAAF